jgi:hypothetical protein
MFKRVEHSYLDQNAPALCKLATAPSLCGCSSALRWESQLTSSPGLVWSLKEVGVRVLLFTDTQETSAIARSSHSAPTPKWLPEHSSHSFFCAYLSTFPVLIPFPSPRTLSAQEASVCAGLRAERVGARWLTIFHSSCRAQEKRNTGLNLSRPQLPPWRELRETWSLTAVLSASASHSIPLCALSSLQSGRHLRTSRKTSEIRL